MKRMRSTTTALAMGVTVTVLFATAASAFNLFLPFRRWFPLDTPREVKVDRRGHATITAPDHDKGVTAALAAVEAWNGGGAGTVLDSRKGPVDYVPGDGRSDIIFDDPLGLCVSGCLAITNLSFFEGETEGCCDGRTVRKITDSDIAFNPNFDFTTVAEAGCSSEYFLEPVVKHEVGHLLGLAHVALYSAPLMAPSLATCDNKQIHSDDLAGLAELYDCTSFTTGACAPDVDDDDLANGIDNCPAAYNPTQADSDDDGHGDACDNCPSEDNPGQEDGDLDRIGDVCDICPTFRFNFPSVRVGFPNGGERLNIGFTHTLIWSTCMFPLGDTAFDVFVSRDNGTSFEPIGSQTVDTALSWTATGPVTTSARLKVVASDGINTDADQSDATFTIAERCGPCVTDFCGGMETRCVWDGTCQLTGCCHYTCSYDPTCTHQAPCPPKVCNGCNLQ